MAWILRELYQAAAALEQRALHTGRSLDERDHDLRSAGRLRQIVEELKVLLANG